MDPKATFAKLMSASTTLETTEDFVSFARQSIAQLCCFNALLWEALIRLVVGRARLKHFLCFEYFRRKTELFQELYFTRDRNRCSSLSNKPTSKYEHPGLVGRVTRLHFGVIECVVAVIFCREVDECRKRPLIIFEENYCRFGQACELCGTRQEGGCVSERHTASSTWEKEASAHCSRADPPRKTFTPMLFADSGSEDGFVPSPRRKPTEKDAAAWKKYVTRFFGEHFSEKARAKLQRCGNISWIMSEPWFLRHADNCFVLRQLHKGREMVDHYCSTTGANIHFIVFVHGLGGRSCDFYWAKRWMKLLITTPKHLLIWSEANGPPSWCLEPGSCGTLGTFSDSRSSPIKQLLSFNSTLKGGTVIVLSSVSVDASSPGFMGEFPN
ncbi:unnamed protein product [Ixodes pacificus]